METQFGKNHQLTCYLLFILLKWAWSITNLVKCLQYTIKCDLGRGFNHPIRIGLVRGFWKSNIILIRGFTKWLLDQPWFKDFDWYNGSNVTIGLICKVQLTLQNHFSIRSSPLLVHWLASIVIFIIDLLGNYSRNHSSPNSSHFSSFVIFFTFFSLRFPIQNTPTLENISYDSLFR